ncbi:MAG: transcription antitermination factor NusB [Candidatus Symbiobacter sp.]|nr:transcription antitermination factor NusB [Candidatus Symbiobacter sp.]
MVHNNFNPASSGIGKKINDARFLALETLKNVLERKVGLEESLANSPLFARSDPRDRALARLMASRTLRHLGVIDAMLDGLAHRASSESDSRQDLDTRHILRLGATQLLFSDIPAYAAISEAGAMADRLGLKRQKPFVNAVLRQIQRDGAARLAAMDRDRFAAPPWLMASWRKTYGRDVARAMFLSLLDDPALDLTPLPGRLAAQELAAAVTGSVLPTGSVRVREAGRVEQLPFFTAGNWHVQDAAAALPARLLGAVAGKLWLDLCAAPGGKTAQLAAAGARVVAVDRSAARIKRVQENLARLGLSDQVTLLTADASQWASAAVALPPLIAQKFDGVLLDAPCSATGTMRRHPDIMWLKSPAIVAKMVGLQAQLLAAAARIMAASPPGTLLLYCVCSLQPEEGIDQIRQFLAAHPEFASDPIASDEIFGETQFITAEKNLLTRPDHWPDWGGIDGFFAARLRKMG